MKKIISKFLIGLSIITPSCSYAGKKYIKKECKHIKTNKERILCSRYRIRLRNECKNRKFCNKDEKYFKDEENRKIIKFDDFRRIVLEMKDKIKELYGQKLNRVNQNWIRGSFENAKIALPFSPSPDDRAAPGLLNRASMTLKEYNDILSAQCFDKSRDISGRNYASMLWTKFHNLGYSVGICKVNTGESPNWSNFSLAKTVCVVPVEKNGNIIPYILDPNLITNVLDSCIKDHNQTVQEWKNDFAGDNPQDDNFKNSLKRLEDYKAQVLDGKVTSDEDMWELIFDVNKINANALFDSDDNASDVEDKEGMIIPLEEPEDSENQFTEETKGLAYSLKMYTKLYYDNTCNFKLAFYSNDQVNLFPTVLSIRSYRDFGQHRVHNLPSNVFPYSLDDFNNLINSIRNSGQK